MRASILSLGLLAAIGLGACRSPYLSYDRQKYSLDETSTFSRDDGRLGVVGRGYQSSIRNFPLPGQAVVVELALPAGPVEDRTYAIPAEADAWFQLPPLWGLVVPEGGWTRATGGSVTVTRWEVGARRIEASFRLLVGEESVSGWLEAEAGEKKAPR